jgi:protein-tyrosine phosphatase
LKFIDIHSHVLQNIDDGSKDIETAIRILIESANQNVDTVILTPHFYSSNKQTVEDFIKRRDLLYNILKLEIKNRNMVLPNLRVGAEVALDSDLSKVEHIEKLAIEGTSYILIEMPYEDWHDWMFESIYSIIASKNLIPIIAHIERYMMKNNELIDKLSKMEVYFQINASSLLDNSYMKETIKLINNNYIHFIGSDAHNMTDRPPRIKDAIEFLKGRVSGQFVDSLCNNSSLLLDNKYIEKNYNYYYKKPKVSIFKSFFSKW